MCKGCIGILVAAPEGFIFSTVYCCLLQIGIDCCVLYDMAVGTCSGINTLSPSLSCSMCRTFISRMVGSLISQRKPTKSPLKPSSPGARWAPQSTPGGNRTETPIQYPKKIESNLKISVSISLPTPPQLPLSSPPPASGSGCDAARGPPPPPLLHAGAQRGQYPLPGPGMRHGAVPHFRARQLPTHEDNRGEGPSRSEDPSHG